MAYVVELMCIFFFDVFIVVGKRLKRLAGYMNEFERMD